MANGNWWFKFEWGDWREDPALRRCSLETQGFWINCLCVMHAADVAELSGSPDELARLIGCFSEELMRCVIELKKTNTADVIIGNGDVSIKSRRRQRELNAKEYNRLQVQKHREKVACNENVMVQSKSKSKSKSKEKEIREEKNIKKENSVSEEAVVNLQTFQITKSLKTWATENSIPADLEFETEQWRDHHISAATKIKDFNASWRKWMRNNKKWTKTETSQSSPKAKSSGSDSDFEYEWQGRIWTFTEQMEMWISETPHPIIPRLYELIKQPFLAKHPDRESEVTQYECTVAYREIADRDEPDIDIGHSSNDGIANNKAITQMPVSR